MILPLVTATAAAFVWRNSWGHATLWSATVISGYWAAVMISQGQGIGWAGALLAAIIALHLTALGANQLRGGWTGHLHTARSAAALTGTSAAGMAMLLTTL